MDITTFEKMSIMDKWDYFWENTDNAIDSVATKNFDYFLMKDNNSNLIFELRVGKIGGMSMKVVKNNDLDKYRKNHTKSNKYPWE